MINEDLSESLVNMNTFAHRA